MFYLILNIIIRFLIYIQTFELLNKTTLILTKVKLYSYIFNIKLIMKLIIDLREN